MPDSQDVSFKFTVSGAISTLTVFEGDKEITTKRRNGIFEGEFVGNFIKNKEVVVLFILAGLNGTKYEIKYDCKVSGKSYTDPENPNPISRDIEEYNSRIEKVTIKSNTTL